MSLVGRNLVWLLLSQVATWALTFVAMLVVPDLLGPDALGTWGFAIAYVGFFGLAVGLGTSTLLTREIARDHSLAPAYVFNALALKVVLTTVCSAVALGLGLALRFSGQTMLLVAIGCAGLYIVAFNDIYASTLSGMQRMGKSSAWAVTGAYVGNIGAIVALTQGAGVVTYMLIITASSALPLFGNWSQLRGLTVGHRVIRRDVLRFLVRAGLPLMLLVVFNQIYTTIDVPILAAMSGTTVVGWYVLAYKWAAIPMFIATVVLGSHYPEMSVQAREGGAAFAAVVNRALQLVLLVAVPAGIGLAVVAGDLIGGFYGADFAEAVRPLQVLALQIPITCVDTVLATALVASERIKRYLVVAGAMALLNPALNVALIHVFERTQGNGAIGAAVATAVTEVLVMVCAVVMSARGVLDRATTWWTVRCLGAGAAIVVVGVVFADAGLLPTILLGIAAYVVAAFALRVVTPAMIRTSVDQLLRALRRRPADQPA